MCRDDYVAVLHSDRGHRFGLLFVILIYTILSILSTYFYRAHIRLMRALEKWDIWMSHKEGAFATGRSILIVCENCCIVPDTVNRQIARFSPVVGFGDAVLMHRGFNKESLCLFHTCHCAHTVGTEGEIDALCFCQHR